MKKLLLLVLIAPLLTACPYETHTYHESAYKPVLMTRENLENSIELKSPKEIQNYGKIYVKGNLLFVNEKYEGIHVVDNSNPEKPNNIAFINIPGNIDISIKNDIIYADNAVDLVAIKYDGNTIQVVDRNRNVFPEYGTPDGLYLPNEYSEGNRPDNTVIVKWIKR